MAKAGVVHMIMAHEADELTDGAEKGDAPCRISNSRWGRSGSWYDSGAGTARRKSTRTTDLEEAKGVITQHYLESSRKPKEEPAEAIAALIFADYLEEHISRKPSAERALISIQHFMGFLEREQNAGRILGAAKIADLTPRLIRKFIGWRRGEHHYAYENSKGERLVFKSKGVTPSSISRDLSVIRAAVTRAWKDGDLAACPYIPDIDKDEKSPPREKVLSQKEFAALLDAAPPHLFMFLMLAFCTAGRRGTMLEAGPESINFENNLIDLNPKGRVQTRKRRPALPIAKTLRPWLMGCREETFVGYDWRGRELTEGERKPRPVLSIKKAFRTAREQVGLGKDVIPYTIRHTLATELRKRGVPEWEVKTFMGHAAMSTTDRYAKYDSTYLLRAVGAIDDYFGELKQYTTRHVRDMTGVVDLNSNHFRTTGPKSAKR